MVTLNSIKRGHVEDFVDDMKNIYDSSKRGLSTLYRRIIQTYPMMHHFSSSTFDWKPIKS
jgi:hypothetical protein